MIDLIDEFTVYLTSQGRSPRTIRGYARDVRLFAEWFQETNGKPAAPALVTPLDVREHRQYLQTVRKQKPSSITTAGWRRCARSSPGRCRQVTWLRTRPREYAMCLRPGGLRNGWSDRLNTS